MKKEKNALTYRRMEVVALRGEGKKNEEIAMITGFHPDMTSKYAKIYLTIGIDGLRDGRKGGNNRLMSKEEASEFLEQFKEKAREGQIITVEAIAKALDEKTGKKRKSLSTAYYLLHSFDWRKLMPRSRHPNKASDEEIDSSKKLKPKSTN